MAAYRCCKPFPGHKCSNTVRPISNTVRNELRSLNPEHDYSNFKNVCSTCYINLKKLPRNALIPAVEGTESSSSGNSENFNGQPVGSTSSAHDLISTPSLKYVERDVLINNINKHIIPYIEGEISPIKKKLCQRESYSKKKSEQVSRSIRKSLFREDLDETDLANEVKRKAIYYDEIIENLKLQFDDGDYLDKQKILSLLPQQMKPCEIRELFGDAANRYLIEQSKNHQRNLLLFSTINSSSHTRNIISEETVKTVKKFYEDDEISRMMPGRQDTVCVRVDGERQHIQKRLMLCSINEAYTEFKKRNPGEKIGLTKFSTLRPVNCVKLGVGNQQNVCVCTLHQNIKLMCQYSKLRAVTSDTFNEYKDLLTYVRSDCEVTEEKCSLSMCTKCLNKLDELKISISECFNKLGVVVVKYKQWNMTDRCNLDTFADSVENFVEKLIHHLKQLIPHHFIAKQQSLFLRNQKEMLQPGECLIQCDFSENYAFVIQDAVQGYHWNNNQATIHPFVVYYKQQNSLQHLSYVMISDCMEHDSVAVHLFKTKLINYLQANLNFNITKMIYISDGAGSQYKNKYNFINLCHHVTDYNIKAEWHFHATNHGKGPCDGIGGTLKRGAHRFSLANKNIIQTPKDLYEWATEWNTKIGFGFMEQSEYNHIKTELQPRYYNAVTIKGTRNYHSFVPDGNNKIIVKIYSNSIEYNVCKIARQ